MRIRLLLKDKDYCRALKDKIGSTDKDIYVEIYDNYFMGDLEENTLIITDLGPERIRQESFENYRERIVFLTENPMDKLKQDETVHRLFKYSSLSTLLSDISQINYLWTGESTSSSGIAKVFSVCSDSSDISSTITKALARQILFRHGGEILVLPLGYVNAYACPDEIDKNRISRLMYYIDIDKEYTSDAFTYADNYGINYLRMPAGLNTLAYIGTESILKLIVSLNQKKYSTVILDVGNNYSERNLNIIGRSDNILYVSCEDKKLDIGDLSDDADVLGRITILHTQNNRDVELRVDDYVKKVFDIEDGAENEDEQKDNSNKVQKSNRRSMQENKKMDN